MIVSKKKRRIDFSGDSLSRERACGWKECAWRSRPRSASSAPPAWASTTRSRGWRSITPASVMCAAATVVSTGFPTAFQR